MNDYIPPAQSPVAGMAMYHYNGQQQNWPSEKRQILMRSTSEPSLNNNNHNNAGYNYYHQAHQQQQQQPVYSYERQQDSPTSTASPEQSFSSIHHSPVDASSPTSGFYVIHQHEGIYNNVPQGVEGYPRSYPPLVRKNSAPCLPPIQQSMAVSTAAFNFHRLDSPPPSSPTYGGSSFSRVDVPIKTYIQANKVKKPRRAKPMQDFAIFSSDHKIFKCSFKNCSSRFSRQEHLKRHENTHFPDRKPYVCHVDKCWRPFSRPDNLKSHLISHTKQGGKNRYVPGLVVD